MAPLTHRLARPLVICLLTTSAARADPPPIPSPIEQDTNCTRLLLDAAAALRNEQYPSMAQLAAERQRACPGPDSLFLLGVARANMVHNGLVARASETLVSAQAIHALTAALDSGALRGEWLQPANAWLQYLHRADRMQTRSDPPPPAPQMPPPATTPPAAAPFEPEPSHAGPLLLASAGIGLLGAGLITAIIATSRRPYDDSLPTLRTATDVLVLTGGVALVAALAWHLLTPRPSDKAQISVAAHLSRRAAVASLRMNF